MSQESISMTNKATSGGLKKYIISLVFILLAVTLANTSLAAKGVIKNIGSGGMSGGITIADLGVEKTGILPTSPFYFLKEWNRGFERLFTFSSVAKADLELKITNEKAAEAKVVLGGIKTSEEAHLRALENYKKSQENLIKRLEALKETSQNPNIDRLLTSVIEREVLHIALFDEFVQKTKHDTVKNSIGNIRARVAQGVAVMSKKDEPEKFAKKIKNAVEKLPGDELRHLRSVEMVDFFEKNSSKDAKESLREIRDEFGEKLAKDLEEFINQSVVGGLVPGGAILSSAISAKIMQLPGDLVRYLVILDEIKNSAMFNPKEYSITKTNAKKVLNQIIDGLDKTVLEHADIAQKAEEQIKRAEATINELEGELAEFAINDLGVSNEKTESGKLEPARISTNTTTERQTPKRDFGDRMKAGLETAGGMLSNAKEHLGRAKPFFADGKFGEVFGQARSAEVLARNGLRIINNIENLIREGTDADAPRIEDINSAMPIVPGIGKTRDQIIPEAEKRVFPETNNRTACDDRIAPGCLRGEILECHNGKWACIGPASGVKEGQTTPITLAPTPVPTTVAPTIYNFDIEADDSGFYPDSTITVPKGSQVKIHFIVRTANVYFAGLDIRSLKFNTESIKPGATSDVEFTADESFIFTSYWPSSGVQKAIGKVVAQ